MAGIFPPAEPSNLDFPGQQELEDAMAQMEKGVTTNYSTVQDNVTDAKVELDRYREAGFLVDVDKDTVKKEMGHGTMRLGLIIKEKPEGIKRRITGPASFGRKPKSHSTREDHSLTRPRDLLNTIRNVYEMRRPYRRDEGYARELAVIDVSDAFMSLAVEERELPHALAPNVETEATSS